MSPKFRTCVLFGGGGFIGSHFAQTLLKNNLAEEVFLADIRQGSLDLKDPRIKYVHVDVRNPIAHSDLPDHADLIVNLAAVHKQPGHEPEEFFATNIPGAHNVCHWAEKIGCNSILFTSSIAAYGTINEEKPKDERSLPMPLQAYGVSKIIAEQIHISWQHGDPTNRRLLIVRPGVIFGPGEKGNVTHLLNAVLNGYFVYTGNKKTRKAGGYVKELCESMAAVLQWQDQNNSKCNLYNFTMNPAPTVEEYVQAIQKVSNKRRLVLNVPFSILLALSYIVYAFAKLLGINQPITPVRVRKAALSNNIVPGFLNKIGYKYHFTLEQAMQDWRQEKPSDWK